MGSCNLWYIEVLSTTVKDNKEHFLTNNKQKAPRGAEIVIGSDGEASLGHLWPGEDLRTSLVCWTSFNVFFHQYGICHFCI